MTVYGEKELRRIRGLGLKSALRGLLLVRPVNAVALGLARPMSARFHRLRRLPVGAPRVEYRLESGASVVLENPSVCDVAKDVFWGGGKRSEADDRHVMRVFEAFAARADTCLDIGSYSGLFTLVAARVSPTIACHSYEILPDVYLLLLRNLVNNDAVVRCRANLCGLGTAKGEVVMPTALSGSILPSSLSLSSHFESGVRIPVDTLDAQFAGREPGTVVIKIDVEGFEAEVIAGGAAFFAAHKPDVVCEVLPGAASAGDRIAAQLLPLGYRLFQFGADGLTERAALVPSRAGKDWLLTTRTAAELAALVPTVPVAAA